MPTPDPPGPGLDPIGNQERLAGVGLSGPRPDRTGEQAGNTLGEANIDDAGMCRDVTALTGPQIRRLSGFTESVRQQISTWGARRRSADLSFDCAPLNALARDFLEGWRVAEGNLPPPREVRRYLDHGIVRDAIAEISAFELSISGYYLEVLGITDADRPTHAYTLELHPGLGISAGVAASLRRATLRYSNDHGMAWSVEGHLLLGGVTAGAGVEGTAAGGLGPDDGQSAEAELVTPSDPMTAAPTRHYFSPAEFDTCDVFMLELQSAAEVSGSNGPAGASVGRASGFQGVLLRADGHGLDFHVTTGDEATEGASASLGAGEAGVQGNVGLSTTVVGGGIFNMGRAQDEGVPRPLERAAPAADPGVSTVGTLHFATGSAQIDGDDVATMQDVVEQMQAIDINFEGALYEVQIIGWASRRWRSARTPEEALAHNRDLAARRAAAAERNFAALLGNPRVRITTGVRELSTTGVESQVEGPEPEDDNAADYRAVDIIVSYNPCRGSERAAAMGL